jgi:hypothetical protein
MLLTIPHPPKLDIGGRPSHDFWRYTQSTPCASLDPRVDSPRVTSLPVSITTNNMSTPHRGLPPPSAMTLPDPSRQPPPPPPPPASLAQSLGVIPQPPHQWHGQEESMRHWLVAKAEEDKRKQEEEKTRQESLRLEQRRIEQSMLRESLQGGVPPQLVPMIYAGMGGASLGQISMDWLHQYASQMQAAQQQQLQQHQHPVHSPPDVRRDSRLLGQAPGTFNPVPPTPPQQAPVQHMEPLQQPPQSAPTFPAYQPPGRPAPTSTPRSATHTQLPRLTTNEMYIHQPPLPPPHNPTSAHPLQQTQTHAEQSTTSPSIYFHHWVPPSESKPVAPQTPASKAGSSNAELSSAHPGQSESSEFRDSPRKRKAQGGHQAQPPPSSSAPMHTSPEFSAGSGSAPGRKGISGSHQRTRSNLIGRDFDGRREGQMGAGAPEDRKVDSRDPRG